MSETYGNLPVVIDPTAWFGRSYSPPQAMDVGAIQNQIANQLSTFLASAGLSAIEVYQFPNGDLDTWWNGTSIAFVLVAYQGTRFSKPLDTSAMLQERTIEFEIMILGRTAAWALLGPGSIFALIEAMESALTGFRPQGCRNAYINDERFPERDPQGRVWIYRMQYEIVTFRPKMEPDYILANLTQITNLVAALANATQATQTIAGDGSLTFAPSTIVVGVLNADGDPARLGVDYNFDAVAGTFAITDSGLLTPGMLVKITTVPVTDTQTIT